MRGSGDAEFPQSGAAKRAGPNAAESALCEIVRLRRSNDGSERLAAMPTVPSWKESDSVLRRENSFVRSSRSLRGV